jgi:hypothetical protein
MADGGALAWFSALDGDARRVLIGGLVEEMRLQDPGIARSLDIWRRGKTVRLETVVNTAAGIRPMPLHIKVDLEDPRLLANFEDRLRSGRLDWAPGFAGGGDDTGPAEIAPLGMGTLIVTERRGELMILVQTNQSATMPTGFAEGKPMPLPTFEGVRALLFQGHLAFVFSWPRPSESEIAAMRQGGVELGVVSATPSTGFFMCSVEGLSQDWCDLPFCLGIEAPEGRRLAPPDVHGELPLTLVLVDASTGIVRAWRAVRGPSAWSKEVVDMLAAQAEGSCDRATYERDVRAAYLRWPDTASMAMEMRGRCAASP